MPNARTATIAVSSKRMTGRWLARTISQPEVAVRAIPDVVATPPSRPAPAIAAVVRLARGDRIPGLAPAEILRGLGVFMKGAPRGSGRDVGPSGCARRRGRAARAGA